MEKYQEINMASVAMSLLPCFSMLFIHPIIIKTFNKFHPNFISLDSTLQTTILHTAMEHIYKKNSPKSTYPELLKGLGYNGISQEE